MQSNPRPRDANLFVPLLFAPLVAVMLASGPACLVEARPAQPVAGPETPMAASAPCITDCRCVQSQCPRGDMSCTACWWTEHTDRACTPTETEKQQYGFSCPVRP